MNKLKIYIGFNERLVCDGIISLIYTRENYLILGINPNGPGLFNVIKDLKIDILIIELGYPTKCNLKYIEDIKTNFPGIKLLLITSFFRQGIINKFIDLGVNAYILKTYTEKELYTALEKLEENESYFCSSVTQLLLKEFQDANSDKNEYLTAREIEVMKYLIDGAKNSRISKELCISLHTVKTHRKNIMDKCGSKNMVSLVRYACRENLIDHDNGYFCASCPYKLAINS